MKILITKKIDDVYQIVLRPYDSITNVNSSNKSTDKDVNKINHVLVHFLNNHTSYIII